MALPSSGELGMRSINAELGRTSTATISLDTAENGGYGAINTNSRSYPRAANPAAISEWYGYNHFSAPTLYALVEIGFEAVSFDTACRNASLGRVVRVWGDGPALQDCNNIYSNATGTSRSAAGYYAENFTQYWKYWNGTSFTQEGDCRI